MNYQEFCKTQYNHIFEETIKTLNGNNEKEKERIAQKFAIREATVAALNQYKDGEASDIWKAVYAAHLHRKAGIELPEEIVNKVVSADNSWAKSSGHAFEEMIKYLAINAFSNTDVEIYLQREISTMIETGQINNEEPDIIWLNKQLKSSAFDLYITVMNGNQRLVYGCIQTKTSIRERATRDREPSEHAMAANFWSVAIVLDGDFLKLPKFKAMVNGGSANYIDIGWHGLYVFSEKYSDGRIFATNIYLNKFKEHALQAADDWLKRRQWMNKNWKVH